MSERTAAVILAAGASRRMGEAKLTMRFFGRTPLEACVDTFLSCRPAFDEIIIAVSDATRDEAARLTERSTRIRTVEGGSERGESVYNALAALDCDIVALHDCARCLVSRDIIERTVNAAKEFGSGVAGVYARDTLHGPDGVIPREGVFMAQTPQSFRYDRILEAYELARRTGGAATDDCALYRLAGYEPHYVEGSQLNQKLTGREDIPLFEAAMGGRTNMDIRMGIGEDTHRLVEGRRLVLGGVELEYERGLLGHSDADVLTHAVTDALLGAAGLPDIGRLFPDTDPRYKDISSLLLLERAAAYVVQEAGWNVNNIDAVVVAQAPKLAPFIDQMRANVARAVGIDAGRVGIKATTTEGLGPEGRGECMTARCVCTIKAGSRQNISK